MRHLFVALTMAACMEAAEWPSFRGDNGSGVGAGTIPAQLGPEEGVRWKTATPPGTSSPIVAGDRIYLTGAEGNELFTLAIDAGSGRVRWKRAVERGRQEALHKLNSPASPTPVTDGENVYAFFADFGLVSYGPDGNERWRVALGPFENLHGMAASPVLAGDRLILVCDQDTASYVIAFHKDSGKVAWKTPRPAVVHGFATPTLYTTPKGEHQVVVPGSYLMTGYSAETGEERWSVAGLSWQIKTTAITSDGVIYATGWAPGADPGQNRPLPPFEQVLSEIDANKDGKLAPEELNPSTYKHSGSWRAIDLNADQFIDAREFGFYSARRSARNVTLAVRPGDGLGDLTEKAVLWRNERFVPQVSSPLLYDGVLYTIKDGGILTSMDPATGAIHKTARIPGAIDPYYSSPVAAGGRMMIASEHGKVTVIRPGADWEPLAVYDFEDNIYATPAITERGLYLRTGSALYAFGGAKAK
ncbi:MAG: PQQ-binding-like beta-propeller repeat protein [Bryobacteraceae bacterium]